MQQMRSIGFAQLPGNVVPISIEITSPQTRQVLMKADLILTEGMRKS